MTGSIRTHLVVLLLGHLLLALGSMNTPASAGTITYNWVGIVDEIAFGADPGVAIGEKMNISLTLSDESMDFNASPEIGTYGADFSSPQQLILAVNIGGRTDIGLFQFATVLNDHNGIDGFSVSSSSPHTGLVFSFDFETSNLGVLTSDALPLSLNPQDFSMAGFTVYERGPPLFMGTLLTTPLPASIGMFLSAITGLFGASLWKYRHLGA